MGGGTVVAPVQAVRHAIALRHAVKELSRREREVVVELRESLPDRDPLDANGGEGRRRHGT